VKRRGLAAIAGVLAAACGAGCSTWGGFTAPHPGQLRRRPELRLEQVTVKLHLARPATGGPPRELLFHVTGDSGWHGLDPLFYDTMAERGHALAGVSARSLRARLHALGPQATPARLAVEYTHLIDVALRELGLDPGTRVVITGLSRGAGLAVVAAGEPPLARRVAGVLIMALTAEEETVRPVAAPFARLERVECPLLLLQSTRDRHVAAAEARRLLGPDTPRRRMVAIEAEGHTFGGARDELFRQFEAGLDWIAAAGREYPPASAR
jgi:pimeloyl-ACP methyl ester carboxylesterase